MLREIFAGFCLLFIISCSDDDNSFQTSEIIFTEIAKGDLGGSNIPESNLVITNSNDWLSLIAQLNSVNNGILSTFIETDIDFEAFMIVAVISDTKISGWDLEITSITEHQNEINVTLEATASDTTVISQPIHIVKIPISSKPLIFM